jgi:hypothetical protein
MWTVRSFVKFDGSKRIGPRASELSSRRATSLRATMPCVVDSAGFYTSPTQLYPDEPIDHTVAQIEMARPWTSVPKGFSSPPKSYHASMRAGFAARPELSHLQMRPSTPNLLCDSRASSRPSTPGTLRPLEKGASDLTWISLPATRESEATGKVGPGSRKGIGAYTWKRPMASDAKLGFGSLSRIDPLCSSFSSLHKPLQRSSSSLSSSGSLSSFAPSERNLRVAERQAQRRELFGPRTPFTPPPQALKRVPTMDERIMHQGRVAGIGFGGVSQCLR